MRCENKRISFTARPLETWAYSSHLILFLVVHSHFHPLTPIIGEFLELASGYYPCARGPIPFAKMAPHFSWLVFFLSSPNCFHLASPLLFPLNNCAGCALLTSFPFCRLIARFHGRALLLPFKLAVSISARGHLLTRQHFALLSYFVHSFCSFTPDRNPTVGFWLLISRSQEPRLLLVFHPIEPLQALKGLFLHQAQS